MPDERTEEEKMAEVIVNKMMIVFHAASVWDFSLDDNEINENFEETVIHVKISKAVLRIIKDLKDNFGSRIDVPIILGKYVENMMEVSLEGLCGLFFSNSESTSLFLKALDRILNDFRPYEKKDESENGDGKIFSR